MQVALPLQRRWASYRWKDLPTLLLFTLIYAALIQATFHWLSPPGTGAIVWLPSGFALAALLLTGVRMWPAVFLGALPSHFLAGTAPLITVGVAAGNTLGLLCGLWILGRAEHFDRNLKRVRDYLWLGLAAMCCGAINAGIGPALIALHGPASAPALPINLLYWWQGDVLGVLLLTPLILTWRTPPRHWFEQERWVETLACFGLALVCGQLALIHDHPGALDSPLRYGTFLFVIWAAVRFGRHGALLIIGLAATQALWGVIRGAGFSANDLEESVLMHLWLFVMVLGIVGIAMALFITEREAAEAALRDSEEKYRRIAETANEGIWVVDTRCVTTYVNRKLAQMLGYDVDEILGRSFYAFMAEDVKRIAESAIQRRQLGIAEKLVFHFLRKDGTVLWVSLSGSPIYDAQGQYIGALSMVADITEFKQAQAREAARAHTMTLIATGTPFRQVLEALVRDVETQHDGARCSILLMDQEGRHLHIGAAPNLPKFFNDAVDGMGIGPEVGSCGMCAALGERVITQDVRLAPSWAPHQALAAQAEIQSCWSEPIRGSNGQVLGTFALYHRHPYTPKHSDIDTMVAAAQVAAIAIERQATEQQALEAQIETSRLLVIAEQSSKALLDLVEHQRKTKNALEEQKAFLNAIIENEPECVKIVDEHGMLVQINPAGLKMLELGTLAEAQQYPLIHFIHADYKEAFAQVHAHVCAGKHGVLTFLAVGKYQTARWLEMHAVPLTDRYTGKTSLLGVTRDITERKRSELALEASRDRVEAILNALPDILIEVDAEGRIVEFRTQMFDRSRSESGQLIGMSIADVLPEHAAETIAASIERARLHGRDSGGLYELDLPTGRRSFELSTASLRQAGEEPGHCILLVRDISDRRAAEMHLYHLSWAINQLSVSVCIQDLNQQVRYANQKFFNMYHIPAESSQDPLVALKYAQDIPPETLQAQQSSLLSGQEWQGELLTRRHDGTSFWVNMRMIPIQGQSGTFDHIIILADDITDQRMQEEMHRKRQEQLAHSARLILMGEMSSTLAHEVNQPLTAIAGYSAACRRELSDDPAAALLYLDKLDKQVRRAGEIVWRMRDFSRAQCAERSSFTLQSLIHDVVEWLGHEARHLNILIETENVNESLPPVIGDRLQIEQVLINLLKNAFEALNDNLDLPNRCVTVAVHPSHGSTSLMVSVEDNGPGLPSEQLDEIFQPFFTTKASGLGLGLSICHSIIEDHGGQLWCAREDRKGACFRFTLPIDVQYEFDAIAQNEYPPN